ncbi:MAG: hypothetical protein WBQ12_02980, partial [Candidatus Sulfotelmatobacter sp.]
EETDNPAESTSATETGGPDRTAQSSAVGTGKTRSTAEETRLGCGGFATGEIEGSGRFDSHRAVLINVKVIFVSRLLG